MPLSRKNNLIASLVRQYGMVDDTMLGKLLRQMRKEQRRANARSLDRVMLDEGLIDRKAYNALVRAFNEEVRQRRDRRARGEENPPIETVDLPGINDDSSAMMDSGAAAPEENDSVLWSLQEASDSGVAPPSPREVASSRPPRLQDEPQAEPSPSPAPAPAPGGGRMLELQLNADDDDNDEDDGGDEDDDLEVPEEDIPTGFVEEPTMMLRDDDDDDDDDDGGPEEPKERSGRLAAAFQKAREKKTSKREHVFAKLKRKKKAAETEKAPVKADAPAPTRSSGKLDLADSSPAADPGLEPALELPDESSDTVEARFARGDQPTQIGFEEDVAAIKAELAQKDKPKRKKFSFKGRLEVKTADDSGGSIPAEMPSQVLRDPDEDEPSSISLEDPPSEVMRDIPPARRGLLDEGTGPIKVDAGGGDDGSGARPLTNEDLRKALLDGSAFDGTRVGDYIVESEIARGGMGVVLKCRPRGLAEIMARERGWTGSICLKVILPAKEKPDPGEIERFSQEVKTLINLHHPNVVRMFDSGVEHGLYYYSMEMIHGVNARELVVATGKPPPLLLTLRMMRECAAAFVALHDAGVYHRDIKPSNVLLDKASTPYRSLLIDFGLVKNVGMEGEKGLIVGTPSYMPPEQARPRKNYGEINATSDIYSLGATFYFMLTGRPPFEHRDPRKCIKMVCKQAPPDPTVFVADLPRSVADIVLRCLQKRQADRYPTAVALIKDLDRLLNKGHRSMKLRSYVDRFFGWVKRKPQSDDDDD